MRFQFGHPLNSRRSLHGFGLFTARFASPERARAEAASDEDPRKVIVLGGGIAGLSVAHELSHRGYEVTVYEMSDVFGGKARSFESPWHTPSPDHERVPGEHGFRFFPGFYRHLDDTMKRIPLPGDKGGTTTAFDKLVPAHEVIVGQEEPYPDITLPLGRGARRSIAGKKPLRSWYRMNFGVALHEYVFFAKQMLQICTTSDLRREAVLERIDWWDFVKADKFGARYKALLASGLTRSLVAMRATKASTKTIGNILLQFLFSLTNRRKPADRVLDGPTSDVWLDPWVQYLKDKDNPVTFETGYKVVGWDYDKATRRIEHVKLEYNGAVDEFGALDHHFVAAIPVERMYESVDGEDDMKADEPYLEHIEKLVVEWMNGILFYLKNDEKLAAGHGLLLDSPWALTSISQAQFWNVDLSTYDHGNLKGILSLCISDWDVAGKHAAAGRTAEFCEHTIVAKEVWAQIKDHLPEIDDDDLLDGGLDSGESWLLDPAIKWIPIPLRMPMRDRPAINPSIPPWYAGIPPTPDPTPLDGKKSAGDDVRLTEKGNHPLNPEPDFSDDILGPIPPGSLPSLRGAQTVADLVAALRAWVGFGLNINLEPLLVNTAGSAKYRPNARTNIRNLFLAADYIRTNTDLATMEAANEAARWAVNGILDADKSKKERCRIWPLEEPCIFRPFKWVDRILFKRLGAGFRIRWEYLFLPLVLIGAAILLPLRARLKAKP